MVAKRERHQKATSVGFRLLFLDLLLGLPLARNPAGLRPLESLLEEAVSRESDETAPGLGDLPC